MLINIISVIALILSLVGNILINRKNKLGFYIWTLSNIVWIIVNFISIPNYPQIIMYLCYACINIDGIIKWTKDEKKTY